MHALAVFTEYYACDNKKRTKYEDKYDYLTDEQKKQVEFVQFHPSYDYSDFC